MKNSTQYITLDKLCETLSITTDTGKNWIKLGKIAFQHKEGKDILFAKEYVKELEEQLKSGERQQLKSRRNKKYATGNGLYSTYVFEDSRNIKSVQEILSLVEKKNVELTDENLQYILAECAIQLLTDSDVQKNSTLLKFLNRELSVGVYDILVETLIADRENAREFVINNSEIFSVSYTYEHREDILGLLYISCKNIGSRKSKGAYYTPTKVVHRLIEDFGKDICDDKKILDPCCGTGNFLLQLPESVSFDNIYGSDIDEIAVKLARINMALKYRMDDVQKLLENICVKNFIIHDKNSNHDKINETYDYIIGNPPWGSEFSKEECGYLRENYMTAVGKSPEAYDIFAENAINLLKDGGIMAFVLPEAVLNVKTHIPIRQFITERCHIQHIDYLGEVFWGVQCPSVILRLKRMVGPMSTIGMRISRGGESYIINTNRDISPSNFSFKMTDEEYEVIQKIENIQDAVYLKDNAIFALGIVTGDNEKHLVNHKNEDNEVLIRGRDIEKYHIAEGQKFMTFTPDKFQQVAPEEYYRAKEKLLYRFIGGKLVFAYDDKGRLPLNSCNVLIPNIEGLHIKYIMAVLNSEVAQFYFEKKFASIKILRSQLEQIPIPKTSEEIQLKMISKVDKLLGFSEDKAEELSQDDYDSMVCRINDEVRGLYGVTLEF